MWRLVRRVGCLRIRHAAEDRAGRRLESPLRGHGCSLLGGQSAPSLRLECLGPAHHAGKLMRSTACSVALVPATARTLGRPLRRSGVPSDGPPLPIGRPKAPPPRPTSGRASPRRRRSRRHRRARRTAPSATSPRRRRQPLSQARNRNGSRHADCSLCNTYRFFPLQTSMRRTRTHHPAHRDKTRRTCDHVGRKSLPRGAGSE